MAALIRDSRSGRELIEGGFQGDVEIALEIDVSRTVPMLRDGAYRQIPSFPLSRE